MVDMKFTRPQLSLEPLKPFLPLLAGICALLALWFAWSGWQQHGDANRRMALEQSRDTAVQATAATLAAERERFAQRLADPVLAAAVAAGQLDHAAELLIKDWPGASDAALVDPTLDPGYAALPEGGYGRLAVLESALAEDQPVNAVIRGEGKNRLALAAPVNRDGEPVAVALVYLPLERLTAPLASVSVANDTYLALRQGNYNIVERGDVHLAGGAEVLAVKVPGNDLRIAAAAPRVAAAPFGLGPLGCGILAGLLALLGVLCWRGPAIVARRQATGNDEQDDSGESALTLAESMGENAAADTDAATATATGSAYAPVALNRGIFRAYDIRGVVGQSLDVGVAELIGHAIGSLMHDKNLKEIVVGRDGRLSGPDMVTGLIAGLRRSGRNVIDIGLAPTPLVYFGAFHLKTGSCVSVTGSHNPPDYNGFKIVVGEETLSGEAITDLYARIAEDRLHTAPVEGSLEQREIDDDYVQRVAADIQLDRALKVVVDAGNGVAGELGPKVLTAIGAEVVPLYCEIDGTFPNHHPDPSEPQNLADLVQMVERLDADLGIAFDGDGDRLGVVTRDGHNIFPDRLLMLFAADVLERNPGAQIIFDVKCTGRLPGYILRHGGSPLMWKTGHSLIKAKMRETQAELAGEMSGHFFFKERWYGFDDGIYAAARLLEILAGQADRPSDLLDALPDGVATAEIKVAAPNDDPHAFVDQFIASTSFDAARLTTIDGLRVDWPDGWGLVRASNTTPVLVMRFDADNQAAMARIKDIFREKLLAVDQDLELPF